MSILDSKLWQADLDVIVTAFPELEELSGKSVMITGCTGLICSALVDMLIFWNLKHAKKIKIIAAARSKEKLDARYSTYIKENWFVPVLYDAASTDIHLDAPCNYIIHGASNASPNKIIEEPVETMLSNFLGMKLLLDYAKSVSAERVLYISSSEIYGKKEESSPYLPDQYGYIDLLNPRNSYSVGKRSAETLCVSYAAEYGVESVIVRPGHIYGPTAGPFDKRVSSAWAYAAARGEDIVLKSSGTQVRSYCHCLDSASAILTVLLKGEAKRAYNISNPDSVISIRQMADILAKYSGVKLRMETATEEEQKGFNPMSNSSLDSTELLNLGWSGRFDPERGFSHTVEILKEIV